MKNGGSFHCKLLVHQWSPVPGLVFWAALVVRSWRSYRRVGSWVATCCATPWRNGIFWPTSGIPTLCRTGGKCCWDMENIYIYIWIIGNYNELYLILLVEYECICDVLHVLWILPIENGTISSKWRLSFFLFGGSSATLHCCCLWRFGARKHMEQKSDAVTKMTKLLVNVPLLPCDMIICVSSKWRGHVWVSFTP